MIDVTNLTKRYGTKVAVNDLSFSVARGSVTGFLGPNGSGKSTTMRMILGLDHPTSGTATIGGKPYRDARWPLREVGALLEARSIHPGRTAYNHLRTLAVANRIPTSRVNEVLRLVGLEETAKKRTGEFSLGMGQRLGIAAAMLGDPEVLLFDEPVNGLDPEGIVWVRTFLRSLAAEGRTVFVSSHLMAEMALTADHLIVIGQGRLKAAMSVDEFISTNSRQRVRVRTPDADRLSATLSGEGLQVAADEHGLIVYDVVSDRVGELCSASNITLHELSPMVASLEEAFMELTRDDVEYHGQIEDAR